MEMKNYNSEEQSLDMGLEGRLVFDDNDGSVYEIVNPEIKRRAKAFVKLFAKNAIRHMRGTSSNHLHVLAYLLEETDFLHNITYVTYDGICKATGVSRPTVAKIMKEFQSTGFIVSDYGRYKVDPNTLAKGFEGYRLKLVNEYVEVKNKAEKKKEEKSKKQETALEKKVNEIINKECN